jgi:uracil-DNA glycosylase
MRKPTEMRKTMSRQRCPGCGYLLVSGIGNVDSDVLVLRDYPDFDDQKNGRHLTGNSAEVLRQEFAKARMSLNACYVTSIFPHVQSPDCSVDYVDNIGELLKGRKKVLLLGSGVVEPLFGRKALDICGVWHTHKMFPKIKFMPCISPTTVLKDDLGEFRIALSRFSKEK